MKQIEKNNCVELIKEVQIIAGKKLTPDQFDRLVEGIGKIDWNKACQIVRDFERMERFPSNIYGIVANRIEDQFRSERQGSYKAELWKAIDADCASSVEWRLFFAITAEIMLWHRAGLAERNPNGTSVPMTSDEWMQQGCPATWSPLLDHFLSGLVKVNNFSTEKREAFLAEYLDILKSERSKRLGTNQPKQEEVFA